MTVRQLLDVIKTSPEFVEFTQVMETIDEFYHYKPTRFKNGNSLVNDAGTNEGSCKVFAFAQLHQLTVSETLACFGHYYRIDVLQKPNGDDHKNIRSFMINGWGGLSFESAPLQLR